METLSLLTGKPGFLDRIMGVVSVNEGSRLRGAGSYPSDKREEPDVTASRQKPVATSREDPRHRPHRPEILLGG